MTEKNGFSDIAVAVRETDQLLDVVRAIDAGGRNTVVVLDADRRLLGIISDGDVRRALLEGHDLEDPAGGIMSTSPITVSTCAGDDAVLAAMTQHAIFAVPEVDTNGSFVRLRHISEFVHAENASNFSRAVIMAGGEGQRLRPLTETVPKPMVDVAGKPLIGHILGRLASGGVRRIDVTINYLGDHIRHYLGDGTNFDAEITYVEEDQTLGTAGALSLLDQTTDEPLLIVNGDILSEFDTSSLYESHCRSQSAITVGVVEYRMEIPYGVIRVSDGVITHLHEKPSHCVHINAGIYAVESRLLKMVPAATPYNMTDLIAEAIEAGERISPFLIHEHWIDVGTPQALDYANQHLSGGAVD